MSAYKEIEDYLKQNGATPFWADSAMQWIQRGLSGNSFFVKAVSSPVVKVVDGKVVQFTCKLDAYLPDSFTTKKVRLRYGFTGTSHSIQVQTAK